MFRNRIVGLALTAFLVVSTGGAHAQDAAPDWLGGPMRKQMKDIRIGITVNYPGSNSYQARYAERAAAYAKELGIQATVMDPEGDPAKQFNQVQDMISQRVDAIVLWPVSETALIPAIRQANNADIPVITSNSEVAESGKRFVTAHTGPDDCFQASQTAEMLGDSLGGSGNIVVIEGSPGYTTSRLRKECFLKTLGEKYPEVTILGSQPANWNRERAQSVMEAFLTRYGKTIDAVYAFDDGMGAGVINALKGAGFQPGEVKLFTCNMFAEGYKSIDEGWETGTNQQSPLDDAELAIRTAIQVINGIEVPARQSIPTPKVDKDNLSEFAVPTW